MSNVNQYQQLQAQDNRRTNNQPQTQTQQINLMNASMNVQPPAPSQSDKQMKRSENRGQKIKAVRSKQNVQKPSSKMLSKKLFPCSNCDYIANREYTLKVHKNQHCKGVIISKKIIKNKICRIYQNSYTHDGLRSHLRGFITASKNNRQVRGIHRLFSVEFHKTYLDKIKLRHLV